MHEEMIIWSDHDFSLIDTEKIFNDLILIERLADGLSFNFKLDASFSNLYCGVLR